MQPRIEEIYRVLTAFVRAKGNVEEGGNKAPSFSLVVHGSRPLQAQIRELRERCAMIDIGSSIFTLAYSDILGMDPVPQSQGSLRVTVRPGSFASPAAARLRRAPASNRPARREARPLAPEREPEEQQTQYADNLPGEAIR